MILLCDLTHPSPEPQCIGPLKGEEREDVQTQRGAKLEIETKEAAGHSWDTIERCLELCHCPKCHLA